jgi:predicted MFS family arabinose efflux permease
LVHTAFSGNASRFSLAIVAFGVGGLFGALVLLGISPKRDRRMLSSWCAIGLGVFVATAALTPWFWTLPPLVLLAGFALTFSNTAANSLLQSSGAPAVRGQTVSMYMLAIRSGMAAGSLVTGMSIHLLGVRSALAVDGALAVIVQLVLGRIWLRSAAVKSNGRGVITPSIPA